MYIFVILAAANQLPRPGALAVGLLSGLLYAVLVVAESTRLLAPVEFAGGLAPLRSMGYAAYQVLIHVVAFLVVAVLSSQLTDRLHQARLELERRGLDLRNLQTLYQAIVTNISSGLMTLDLSGRVLSFNEAAERITGHRFGAIRDRPWQDTPFAGCGPLAEFYARPEAPPAHAVTEMPLVRGDGREIPVGIAVSPLRAADGEIVGLVTIFQDLTERKRVEEQLRQADRLAALGRLAATIAHEVRNPLAAISGSVEVLRDELSASGQHRELLDIILGEAHRLKFITGQFLDFAKPQPLLCRPCLLRPLVSETLQLLERSSEWHPDTQWTLQEAEAGLQVLADADQLRQVLWNLCLNAIQSMPDGGTLAIALRAGAEGPAAPPDGPPGGDHPGRPSAWVEIAVSDTGRGIPSEHLERVFDPFYTTRPSGTGLGLSIARKALERMGGRIGVESRLETGTTFRIRLQRAAVAVELSRRA
jgi:two-component system sensor histidine kinase PilS (NtrC family)